MVKKCVLFGIVLIALSLSIMCCVAANNSIRFNSKTFTLKYSKVNQQVIMNEYYLPNQKGFDWTELLVVLRIPNLNDPAAYADTFFKTNASGMPKLGIPAKGEKEAYVVTYVDGRKMTDYYYIEPNVMRVEKCKNGGLCIIQHATKLVCKDSNEAHLKLDAYLKTEESKFMELIKKVPMPAVVEKDYQAW